MEIEAISNDDRLVQAILDIEDLCRERYFEEVIDVNDNDTIVIQYGNIIEELSEGMKGCKDEYESIDYIVDQIIFSLSSLTHMGIKFFDIFDFCDDEVFSIDTSNYKSAQINSINNMISFSILGDYFYEDDRFSSVCENFYTLILANIENIKDKGYIPHKVLQEALKEVSSRKQCPIQKEHGREKGEKWKKDRNQVIIYKARYLECKV